MAYFHPTKSSALVRAFVGLPEPEKNLVCDTNRTKGAGVAARLTRMLGPYEDKGTRVYELSQPAYATVQDVNARLGKVAASVVENVLCGDATTLHGLDENEQKLARSLASLRGVQLP